MSMKVGYLQRVSVKDPVFFVSLPSYDWSGSQNSQFRRVGEHVSSLYQDMIGRWVLELDIGVCQRPIEIAIKGVALYRQEDRARVERLKKGIRRIRSLAEPLQRQALKQLVVLRKGSIEDRPCISSYLQILDMVRASQRGAQIFDCTVPKTLLENRLRGRAEVDAILQGIDELTDVYAKRPMLQRELQSLDAMRVAVYALDNLPLTSFIVIPILENNFHI